MSACEQHEHRVEHSGSGNPWPRMPQLQRNGGAGREDVCEGWWEALPASQTWILVLPMSPVGCLVLGERLRLSLSLDFSSVRWASWGYGEQPARARAARSGRSPA